MTAKTVYEKYKHIDRLLANPPEDTEDAFVFELIKNLWAVVKYEATKEENTE